MEEFESSDYPLHDHPLIYIKDEQESSCCSACGLQLSSTPSYKCKQGCNFFLHKACRKLPQNLNYVSAQGAYYDLVLDSKQHSDEQDWTCQKCGKLCENLIAYVGRLSSSSVYFHALCAFPFEMEHDSHEHKLVPMLRKASLIICDACGRGDEGFFFTCKEYEYSCDFWIHKDCAELPRVIQTHAHRHPLALSYSAFDDEIFSSHFIKWKKCAICKQKFSRKAAYSCESCGWVAHLDCARKAISSTWHFDRVSELPIQEADRYMFISGNINSARGLIKEDTDPLTSQEQDEIRGRDPLEDKTIMASTMLHHHPLILRDHKYANNLPINRLCNACIQPITIDQLYRYYACEEIGCDFLLHEVCGCLPSKLCHEVLTSVTRTPTILQLVSKDLLSRFSIYSCLFCRFKCNGIGYKEFKTHRIIFDLECAGIPTTIKHKLHHDQHILSSIAEPRNLPFPCCSDSNNSRVYKCHSCDFQIHNRCALLPTKVRHKFDKHPLQLSSKSQSTNVNDNKHYFCEVCEGHIDTKLWFYHCMDCDQFFHIECIPSKGALSKIKFGVNFVIACHPQDHPVTLTRMLNIGNQKCGKCKEIIQGLVDDMAFQCTKCCYWIHFDCAEEAGSLTKD